MFRVHKPIPNILEYLLPSFAARLISKTEAVIRSGDPARYNLLATRK